MSQRISRLVEEHKPPFKSLKSAAGAACEILSRLSFVDEEDAKYARLVEEALRRLLKEGGGK